MNKELLPVNSEKLSGKQYGRLLSMSRRKAGIVSGRVTSLRRSIIVAAAAIISLTAGVGAVMHFVTVQAAANEDDGLPYRVLHDALHVGKYYADGDTTASYFEIYDDGTLQWKGIDHYEYAKKINIEHGALYGREWDKEMEEATVELAAEYAARHTYTVVYWKSPDITMVMYDWSEDSKQLGGTGCKYIDENTIVAHGITFVYTPE